MKKIDGKLYVTVNDLRQQLADQAGDALVLIDAGGVRVRGETAFCPVERVESYTARLYAGFFFKSHEGYRAILLS